MVRDDFAIFILAHGRPDNIYTVDTLKKSGYTGKWFIILDDEDDTVDGYKAKFGGDHCVVFSKEAASKKFDVMDQLKKRNVIVFARNMCNEIARNLGLKYFAEFEDDYFGFTYRYEDTDEEGNIVLRANRVDNLDECCEAMLTFIDDVSEKQPKFRSVAFCQAGDLIGGVGSGTWKKHYKRKAMNTFFFKVPDDPKDDVMFLGRMNDDCNLYLADGKIGGIWLQISNVCLLQQITQKAAGGNATAYKDLGTYQKSFYSVMLNPSACQVAPMGPSSPRYHHRIDWEHAVPKIVNECYRK